ncbi:MAG: cupin domain-containing protein [Chitinophagaceae bacterium]|nr:cupin domain-containing protein [Chitinophagaceae bacterium]
MAVYINNDPKVIRHILHDDGRFPNSSLFVLIYKNAFYLPEEEAASVIEGTFKNNDWGNLWRNGIYDYHHFHSNTHEVLGVYEGETTVQLGGPNGISEKLERGDVIIIPAGVAHKNIEAGKDFKCVGAYPEGKDFDIKKGDPTERPEADKNINEVLLPENDPVYGETGLLMLNWEMQ